MLSRYYHTLRYLKLTQITGRIRQRLYRPKPNLSPAPARAITAGVWSTPCQHPASMLGPTHFRFLNQEKTLSFPDAWNSTDISKLWLYNLHYFEDLNAFEAQERTHWHQDLIQRWITENPPAAGNGWEPYPLSLRIVNWIKWVLAGNYLSHEAIQSLAVQIRQLQARLEFHLLGNHLFENAKTLIFAGLFFSGAEAGRWFIQGHQLLEEQIKEQILPDGGHFELSPMYHSLILEGMLDLINIHACFGRTIPDSWQDTVRKMRNWLQTMCHPDGKISFFNDAAFGIAATMAELEAYAARLGLDKITTPSSSCLLGTSAYARLERDGMIMLADVAAIGPDYLPGHAHADSLSFELSLHGQRILVNSGTSIYGTGPERQQERGTAAHNTIRVDGLDSSGVWSGFRVARRARVQIESFEAYPVPQLTASHNGYQYRRGRPIHQRSWIVGEKKIEIKDLVDGKGKHLVEVFFHIHPDIQLETHDYPAFLLLSRSSGVALCLHVDEKISWQVEPSYWHPGFGLSERNLCLIGRYYGPLPIRISTQLTWSY